jgi:hypothetical protein
MSEKYTIEAGSAQFTITHNFYEGFAIKRASVVVKHGMTLNPMSRLLADLVRREGASTVTVTDLETKETEKVAAEEFANNVTHWVRY